MWNCSSFLSTLSPSGEKRKNFSFPGRLANARFVGAKNVTAGEPSTVCFPSDPGTSRHSTASLKPVRCRADVYQNR